MIRSFLMKEKRPNGSSHVGLVVAIVTVVIAVSWLSWMNASPCVTSEAGFPVVPSTLSRRRPSRVNVSYGWPSHYLIGKHWATSADGRIEIDTSLRPKESHVIVQGGVINVTVGVALCFVTYLVVTSVAKRRFTVRSAFVSIACLAILIRFAWPAVPETVQRRQAYRLRERNIRRLEESIAAGQRLGGLPFPKSANRGN